MIGYYRGAPQTILRLTKISKHCFMQMKALEKNTHKVITKQLSMSKNLKYQFLHSLFSLYRYGNSLCCGFHLAKVSVSVHTVLWETAPHDSGIFVAI